MTNAQENRAINWAKEAIQKQFTQLYGFAPSKKDIIPLEAGYSKTEIGDYYCDSLGFRVGRIGYSYRIGEGTTKNDAYDA